MAVTVESVSHLEVNSFWVQSNRGSLELTFLKKILKAEHNFIVPGWAWTTNLSVNSRARWPIAAQRRAGFLQLSYQISSVSPLCSIELQKWDVRVNKTREEDALEAALEERQLVTSKVAWNF